MTGFLKKWRRFASTASNEELLNKYQRTTPRRREKNDPRNPQDDLAKLLRAEMLRRGIPGTTQATK